jgi:23S rRNA (uracil1939-C5)-methyltransferase
LPLSRHFKSISAVEVSKDATQLLARAVAEQCLSHVEVHCENVERFVVRKCKKADTVVVNPPYSGITRGVREAIGSFDASNTIVYVSCNPMTLTRDVHHFIQMG